MRPVAKAMRQSMPAKDPGSLQFDAGARPVVTDSTNDDTSGPRTVRRPSPPSERHSHRTQPAVPSSTSARFAAGFSQPATVELSSNVPFLLETCARAQDTSDSIRESVAADTADSGLHSDCSAAAESGSHTDIIHSNSVSVGAETTCQVVEKHPRGALSSTKKYDVICRSSAHSSTKSSFVRTNQSLSASRNRPALKDKDGARSKAGKLQGPRVQTVATAGAPGEHGSKRRSGSLPESKQAAQAAAERILEFDLAPEVELARQAERSFEVLCALPHIGHIINATKLAASRDENEVDSTPNADLATISLSFGAAKEQTPSATKALSHESARSIHPHLKQSAGQTKTGVPPKFAHLGQVPIAQQQAAIFSPIVEAAHADSKYRAIVSAVPIIEAAAQRAKTQVKTLTQCPTKVYGTPFARAALPQNMPAKPGAHEASAPTSTEERADESAHQSLIQSDAAAAQIPENDQDQTDKTQAPPPPPPTQGNVTAVHGPTQECPQHEPLADHTVATPTAKTAGTTTTAATANSTKAILPAAATVPATSAHATASAAWETPADPGELNVENIVGKSTQAINSEHASRPCRTGLKARRNPAPDTQSEQEVCWPSNEPTTKKRDPARAVKSESKQDLTWKPGKLAGQDKPLKLAKDPPAKQRDHPVGAKRCADGGPSKQRTVVPNLLEPPTKDTLPARLSSLVSAKPGPGRAKAPTSSHTKWKPHSAPDRRPPIGTRCRDQKEFSIEFYRIPPKNPKLPRKDTRKHVVKAEKHNQSARGVASDGVPTRNVKSTSRKRSSS